MSRSKQQVTRHVLMGPKTLGRPREEPSVILGRALVPWYMKIHLKGGGQPITCKLGANSEVIVFEW